MKKVIPFGDRILVRRIKVGDAVGRTFKEGGVIIRPDSNQSSDTDIAEVVHVPDHTYADKHLLEGFDKTADALAKKMVEGDVTALKGLLEYNHYVRIKSIRPGDRVFINKYIGTTFQDSYGKELTMVSSEEVIGLVVKDE